MDAKTPTFLAIQAALQKAERILLVADGKPDGDSIGSTSAFYTWLHAQQKEVRAFCAEPIPKAMLYLPGAHDFTNDPTIFSQPFDLVLTFDAGDLRHCGIEHLLPNLPTPYDLVVFDHHATNTRYGTINAVWPDVCSTAELVYQFFRAIHAMIDSETATALLTGILTDTSCFSNAGTTPSGVEAASHLCRLGARQPQIINRLVQNKSVPSLRIWGTALSRLHYHAELDITSTYFLQRDLTQLPDPAEAVEGIANFLNAVNGGSDTVLVLRELPDGYIKGSLRSITRDVSMLARSFGGGGHKKAAGFTVKGTIRLTDDGYPEII